MIVRPNGNKWWRFKYRFEGRAKEISLGVYPDVKLKAARDLRDEYREDVAAKIDPSAKRQAEDNSKNVADKSTFEAVALEWLLVRKKPVVIESSYERIKTRLENDIFPYLGSRPVNKIKPTELLEVLRMVTDRGAIETAHRILSSCDAVFRYAIATGRAESSPARDLKDALTAVTPGEFAAITEPDDIGVLLRAIDCYKGTLTTRIAL